MGMRMINVTMQIGNSDDALSQQEWSEFVARMDELVKAVSSAIHFFGTSSGEKPWQNACWAFDMEEHAKEEFVAQAKRVRIFYQQDSVAIVFGKTEMI
jgi:hypothetical protein